MTTTVLSVSVGLLSGIVGFIMGALLQQDASYRGIQTAMANDPYIFQSRQNIFKALGILGQTRRVTRTPEQNNSNRPSGDFANTVFSQEIEDSLFTAYVRWFQNNVQAMTIFFTFSLGEDPLPLQEPAVHVATLMKYGFPGLDDIHVYRNFVLSYDRRHRIAHWVCEHLVNDSLCDEETVVDQRQPDYITDLSIPNMFRSSLKDYRHTEWVTGQMASPNNYKCDEVNHTETYLLTNIIPFSVHMRSNVWLRLENYVRDLVMKCGSVYVYTGPLFMPQRITFRHWAIRHQVIGSNTVAVPTHFFKVIIAECRSLERYPYVEGYVVPNTDVDKDLDLTAFLTDIRDIEHFAGLKFFDGTAWASVNQK